MLRDVISLLDIGSDTSPSLRAANVKKYTNKCYYAIKYDQAEND